VSGFDAVRCRACGGAVANVPGRALPACLFCGASAADLVPIATPEGIEPPEGAIGFAYAAAAAQASFAAFAQTSFWYPNDLRHAKLELSRLLLPAWSCQGTIETHWTGLVPARTSSGKAPIGGHETLAFPQVLVPGSSSITIHELAQIGRFDEAALVPWEPASTSDPYEVSALTRSSARRRAVDEMQRRHEARLAREHGTVELKAAAVCLELGARPVLVPVYIGAYRYGRRVYRVLVNGQSGQLVADMPWSWWKIGGVIVGSIALAVLIAVVCAGLLSGGLVALGT
jgi:hypothetical protein